jgi:hypothetical protein
VQLPQESFKVDFRVPQGSLQREAVDLGVVGEHNDPAVRVTHLDVTAFAVDFNETETLESCKNLPS